MPFGTSIIGKDGGEGKNDWDSTAYNMIIANETIAFIDKHLDDNMTGKSPHTFSLNGLNDQVL